MTPSNANTSGLTQDLCERLDAILVEESPMHPFGCATWEEASRVAIDMAKEVIVTAASAQAIIDRLKLAVCGGEDVPGAINLVTIEDCERFCREAQAQHGNMIDRATAAEARADRLAAFGQHISWELSFCYLDDEEGEPGCWAVHQVNGGRNDREWTLIGRGDTPDDAIQAALQQEG